MQRAEPAALPRTRSRYPLTFIVQARGRNDLLAKELRDQIGDLGYSAPYVLATSRGHQLVSALKTTRMDGVPPATDELLAKRRAAVALAVGSDVVVAAGGGRALDLGKAVATKADLPLIVIPTQLSHDGVVSPLAILTDARGHKQTVVADPPDAVFFPLPLLTAAPVQAFAAGIGDLLSNEYALMDWQLAQRRGRDEVDPRAESLAQESMQLIESLLEGSAVDTCRDPLAIALLGTALVNSGMAMFEAGNSRPASGAEHKISHAIDALLGPRALHGAQVAFGCMVSAHLYGGDTEAVRAQLSALGLPTHPDHLQMTDDELQAVLTCAAQMRPDRYTILHERLLDEADVRTVISELWGQHEALRSQGRRSSSRKKVCNSAR